MRKNSKLFFTQSSKIFYENFTDLCHPFSKIYGFSGFCDFLDRKKDDMTPSFSSKPF